MPITILSAIVLSDRSKRRFAKGRWIVRQSLKVEVTNIGVRWYEQKNPYRTKYGAKLNRNTVHPYDKGIGGVTQSG